MNHEIKSMEFRLQIYDRWLQLAEWTTAAKEAMLHWVAGEELPSKLSQIDPICIQEYVCDEKPVANWTSFYEGGRSILEWRQRLPLPSDYVDTTKLTIGARKREEEEGFPGITWQDIGRAMQKSMQAVLGEDVSKMGWGEKGKHLKRLYDKTFFEEIDARLADVHAMQKGDTTPHQDHDEESTLRMESHEDSPILTIHKNEIEKFDVVPVVDLPKTLKWKDGGWVMGVNQTKIS